MLEICMENAVQTKQGGFHFIQVRGEKHWRNSIVYAGLITAHTILLWLESFCLPGWQSYRLNSLTLCLDISWNQTVLVYNYVVHIIFTVFNI